MGDPPKFQLVQSGIVEAEVTFALVSELIDCEKRRGYWHPEYHSAHDLNPSAWQLGRHGNYWNPATHPYRLYQSENGQEFAQTFDRTKSLTIDYGFVYVWEATGSQTEFTPLYELEFVSSGAYHLTNLKLAGAQVPSQTPAIGLILAPRLRLPVTTFEGVGQVKKAYRFYFSKHRLTPEQLGKFDNLLERTVALWDPYHTTVYFDGDPQKALPPHLALDELVDRPHQTSFRMHLVDPLREAEIRATRYKYTLEGWADEREGLANKEPYNLAKRIDEFLARKPDLGDVGWVKDIHSSIRREVRTSEELHDRLLALSEICGTQLARWIGRSVTRRNSKLADTFIPPMPPAPMSIWDQQLAADQLFGRRNPFDPVRRLLSPSWRSSGPQFNAPLRLQPDTNVMRIETDRTTGHRFMSTGGGRRVQIIDLGGDSEIRTQSGRPLPLQLDGSGYQNDRPGIREELGRLLYQSPDPREQNEELMVVGPDGRRSPILTDRDDAVVLRIGDRWVPLERHNPEVQAKRQQAARRDSAKMALLRSPLFVPEIIPTERHNLFSQAVADQIGNPDDAVFEDVVEIVVLAHEVMSATDSANVWLGRTVSAFLKHGKRPLADGGASLLFKPHEANAGGKRLQGVVDLLSAYAGHLAKLDPSDLADGALRAEAAKADFGGAARAIVVVLHGVDLDKLNADAEAAAKRKAEEDERLGKKPEGLPPQTSLLKAGAGKVSEGLAKHADEITDALNGKAMDAAAQAASKGRIGRFAKFFSNIRLRRGAAAVTPADIAAASEADKLKFARGAKIRRFASVSLQSFGVICDIIGTYDAVRQATHDKKITVAETVDIAAGGANIIAGLGDMCMPWLKKSAPKLAKAIPGINILTAGWDVLKAGSQFLGARNDSTRVGCVLTIVGAVMTCFGGPVAIVGVIIMLAGNLITAWSDDFRTFLKWCQFSDGPHTLDWVCPNYADWYGKGKLHLETLKDSTLAQHRCLDELLFGFEVQFERTDLMDENGDQKGQALIAVLTFKEHAALPNTARLSLDLKDDNSTNTLKADDLKPWIHTDTRAHDRLVRRFVVHEDLSGGRERDVEWEGTATLDLWGDGQRVLERSVDDEVFDDEFRRYAVTSSFEFEDRKVGGVTVARDLYIILKFGPGVNVEQDATWQVDLRITRGLRRMDESAASARRYRIRAERDVEHKRFQSGRVQIPATHTRDAGPVRRLKVDTYRLDQFGQININGTVKAFFDLANGRRRGAKSGVRNQRVRLTYGECQHCLDGQVHTGCSVGRPKPPEKWVQRARDRQPQIRAAPGGG